MTNYNYYICRKCDNVFPKAESYQEIDYNYGADADGNRGVDMPYDCCPDCKSDDLDECHRCEVCENEAEYPDICQEHLEAELTYTTGTAYVNSHPDIQSAFYIGYCYQTETDKPDLRLVELCKRNADYNLADLHKFISEDWDSFAEWLKSYTPTTSN